MRLTKDQIQELYSFVRKHYVEHYDLQMELVDHLANGIEEQWHHHPERTFNEARFMEFKNFGVTGFEEVINEKRRSVRKKYRSIVWGFYKDFFRLPKVILVLGLVLLIATVLILVPFEFRYNTIIGIFYCIVLILFYLVFKIRKDNELETVQYGKKWMLKDQIYTYGELINIVNLLPVTLNMKYLRNNIPMDNVWVLVSFSIGITCTIILSYVLFFVIPSKADELLAKTYPEYKMFNFL
ncbi:TIGR04222 domain-containing protein [Zobellia roscoffensis]|uniref:hypothetical protein n=1 Tax=Zobellia roscoffensis TaxID=2779508 RepID=UPI00188B13EE|nr:hypothetical protein [Zobellia roscoffensis]